MKQGIHISRVWSDDDVVELRICVSDGSSLFTNQVYVGQSAFEDAATALLVFKDHMHGGLFDLRLGEFGPEYAKGAFRARFHFPVPGRLFVSCEQESTYAEFAKKVVASSQQGHDVREVGPALLDRFVAELCAVAAGTRTEAYLESV